MTDDDSSQMHDDSEDATELPDNDDAIESSSSGETSLILAEQTLPERLLLLPIFERPFFPAQVQPLVVDAEPWEETFEHLSKMNAHLLGLSYAGDSEGATTEIENFSPIGCVVRLHNVVNSNGKIQFIAQGLQRFKIDEWISDEPPYAASVSYPEEQDGKTPEIKAYAMALIQAIKELIPLNPLYNECAVIAAQGT